ncbi:alpha/beta hydrolase [Sediminibacterium sp.]|uniref:alpha/beta hydrolase n=1 Tax=Sediminibacterium sp. TaxID=1917865 RepID=UPI003F6E7B0B
MKYLFSTLLILSTLGVAAQQEIPLYIGKIPNAKNCGTENKTQINPSGREVYYQVNTPTLTIYQPSSNQSNKTAVLILPGGGYAFLAANHEGHDIAKAFVDMGVSAFVLKYRLPNDSCMYNKEWVPLLDAQAAMKYIRGNAREFGINPDKIGVIGFSAGGHLASTLATKYQLNINDLGSRTSARPDFAILGYPVISMDSTITHAGSRNKLLGFLSSASNVEQFSSELQVNKQTPPCFIFHAKDDKTVPVENSLKMKAALDAEKVSNELLLMENGGHGFGLHNKQSNIQWFDEMKKWLKSLKII